MLQIRTKLDYDTLIDKMIELVNNYEKNPSKFNRYNLFLANGKRIEYTISPNNIAHLLGINTDDLSATSLIKASNSYDFLKKVLEQNYFLYQQVQQENIQYHTIFSQYADLKLEAFSANIATPRLDEIKFVCEYDRSRTYLSGDQINYSADYYIGRELEDGAIMILGLVQKENGFYAPQTSMVFGNDEFQEEKLSRLLKGQVITFINHIAIHNSVTGFEKKNFLNVADKETILTKLRYICEKYSAHLITYADHEFSLRGNSIKEKRLRDLKNTIEILNTYMKEGIIVPFDEIDTDDMDSSLLQLFQTYNNLLCRGLQNENVTNSYMELYDSNQQKIAELGRLQFHYNQLLRTNQKTQDDNRVLKEENDRYQELENGLLELVKTKTKHA